MAEERSRGRNVTSEIREHICTLARKDSGWTKELNLVSWNGKAPKFDVREWSPDHSRMSKGLTLFDNEMRHLVEGYQQFCERQPAGSCVTERQAPAGGSGAPCAKAQAEEPEEQAVPDTPF